MRGSTATGEQPDIAHAFLFEEMFEDRACGLVLALRLLLTHLILS